MTFVDSIDTKLNNLVKEKTDGVFATFPEFYRGNQQYVRNILYRFGIINDLDDIVQITFVRAWKKLHKFEKRSKIKTWLTRITLNAAYDHFRKSKNREIFPAEHTLKFEHNENENENRQLLTQALNAMSLEHRVVIVLCLIEGYTIEETAHIVDVPIGTIKSRLNRARSSMHTTLTEMGVDL